MTSSGLLFHAIFQRRLVVAVKVETIDDVHQFVLAGFDGDVEDLLQKIHEMFGKVAIESGDGILVAFRGSQLLVMSRHDARANAYMEEEEGELKEGGGE